MLRDRSGYPSALHPSKNFHRKDLPPLRLAEVFVDTRPWAQTGIAEFAISTPEVRCWIKGALVWTPGAANPLTLPEDYWFIDAGLPFSRFHDCSLWLTKRQDCPLNGRGCENVENLLGDIFNFAPIPQPGCLGYLFEVQTTAEEIWGRVNLSAVNAPGAGQWMLLACADLESAEVTKEEWDRLTSRFYAKALKTCQLSWGQPA